ncbi:Acetyltransferase, GNAT family [Octadecabacter temperatus]|uniref:Putative N-acetyltransferase YafP n=1 Tax=Octadecabacter temperatus TaxID=1458307 RepID=A0A0K0Y2N8_9RHOB|nr:GNAT family N-acetyltransferase [Octadecabacter temperatus]AKS45172.1 putative N-acetyltransferase YafP [Octadecabacter temperatus]SIN87589.1 Acetyltransferase, GNAT family [Octadecabacter temperatus]
MTHITYRRSTASDAPEVFDLVTRSILRLAPHPYDQGVVDTWMIGRVAEDYRPDCADQCLWIAEVNEKQIGFAHGVLGEVMRLFVDADFVGIGAGAGLMDLALADALQNGSGKVRIDATLNAVPFYKKWGFIEIGTGVFSGRDEELPPIDIVKLERMF